MEVLVSGTGFQGANAVLVTGGGVNGEVVKIENPTTLRIAVTIAPDADLGERDLRVISPAAGASNRFRFFVGELPEINEKEPNSLKSQAQPLAALPLVINGQIHQSDKDFFRFAAKAGQTLVCEVQARRLLPYIADAVPGWMEAYLTLYDADGKELASASRFRSRPDPVLIYKVPRDGDYLIEIRDLFYRGREDFVYRLSIGAFPFITDIFPLGGKRNSDVQVELEGANLPVKSMKLALPANSSPLRQVSLSHLGLNSNALPFAVGDHGEIQETEPNDSLDKANTVEVPITINGRIQRSGDADYFRFTAKKGQRFIMEVQARRLGSPLDSIIALFNSRGGLLAEQDDTEMDDPLLTHHADSRLDYTFPADGEYVLRILDVQGRGGKEYAYRLHIVPPRPDFALRTVPENPRLGEGDTAFVTVKALRKDGFIGDINLAVKNLPRGFVASKAIIQAGQSETRLTITSPSLAPGALLSPNRVGSAKFTVIVDGKPGETVALLSPNIVGTATLGEEPVVREAEGAEDIMQAFSLRHDVPTREILVSVLESADFTLSSNIPSTEIREVHQNSQVPVVVKVSRKGMVAKVAQAEAAKKTAEGNLARLKGELAAATKAYEAAEKAAKEAKPAAAGEKRKLANEAKAQRDKLAADEKAAGPALEQAGKTLEAAKNKAKDGIQLTADPLPGGITFTPVTIPGDKSEVTVTLGIPA